MSNSRMSITKLFKSIDPRKHTPRNVIFKIRNSCGIMMYKKRFDLVNRYFKKCRKTQVEVALEIASDQTVPDKWDL